MTGEEARAQPLRSYLVHYGEIALKGGNRDRFEWILMRNIEHALRGTGVQKVSRIYGRIRIDQDLRAEPEEVARRLARVFGIAHFEPVESYPWDLEDLEKRLGEVAREGGFSSFGVRAHRIEKAYPLRSNEIERRLGALIEKESGARVDLNHPERWFHIKVASREIFFHSEQIPGPGGLPTGSTGRVGLLLSGGIDSPVAALRMMRRGCHLVFIHFHSAPFTDRSSVEKAIDLAQLVSRHRISARLYVVPLGQMQRAIVEGAPAPWRILLYRRAMLRIAERLARRNRCLALATGDNLGQVSSQTLDNLTALDKTVDLPILRPLIGYDKQEIIAEAKEAGTFSLSIEPFADCCSFLTPPNPVIAARSWELEAIEEKLDLEEHYRQAMRGVEIHRVGDIGQEVHCPV